MRVRTDGSIQPTATPTPQNIISRKDYGLYRGMVTVVKYVDDQQNITQNSENPEVLYDVVILGGLKQGQIVSNCRLSSDFGGNFNYYERVLPASSKRFNEVPLEQHDGAIVFFEFTQGHSGYPVIVAVDGGTKTVGKTGATKDEGPILRREYNGVFELIDKFGDYTYIKKNGEINTETGQFEPNTSGFSLETTIKGSVETKKYNTDVITEEINGEEEKKILTFKSGLVLIIDGQNDNVKIQTNKGTNLLVDGSTDKVDVITNGGARAVIDGENDTVQLRDNASGEIKITGETIAIGASTAELLQQISDDIDAVAQWAGSTGAIHTHTGNLGYPTSIPVETAQYIQLQTDLLAIKALVDGIKGTL